ncbi:uncharacterized protein J4E84_006982 [Alternaria hordeiaustralica]|uniref:uncharacterized protein n=1 Tax=Alternaria hordeiaustralica TaxID=1187925 RepID=UPI0020C39D99|nr:uncharacterized protein J4E84_006982 [Alternaria hordeiaustralica]KAI4683080.1 hypothetical protein J4E84_006982 [Alternaria hordeiaustralica]
MEILFSELIAMTLPTGLVAESEMKRIRECATENETLARCWDKPHVALVSMEWAPSGLAYCWNGWISCNEARGYWKQVEAMRVLSVEITTPASPAVSSTEDQSDDGQNKAHEYRFWVPPKWNGRPNVPQSSFVSTNKAVAGLEKMFRDLSSTYPTICVCFHRPTLTRQGLADIGFKLPKGTILVDMIKVLEYQSRFRDMPPKVKRYINSCLNVDMRDGVRFGERFDASDSDALASDFNKHAPKYGQTDEWREIIRKKEDLPAGTLLKILGPEAEAHLRQIKKIEKMYTLERDGRWEIDEAKQAKEDYQKQLAMLRQQTIE